MFFLLVKYTLVGVLTACFLGANFVRDVLITLKEGNFVKKEW